MSELESFRGGDTQKVKRDAEYVAVLRDIEPAGTAEFAKNFDVSQEEARRRLKRLSEGKKSPVDCKMIGGSLVWFVDESGLEAGAATAAEEIRRRMGIEEEQ